METPCLDCLFTTLPVQIVVTGHYGCGGVAAAISGLSPELGESVAKWVQPIRNLYTTSERPEIVELRNANVLSPANDNPGVFHQ